MLIHLPPTELSAAKPEEHAGNTDETVNQLESASIIIIYGTILYN